MPKIVILGGSFEEKIFLIFAALLRLLPCFSMQLQRGCAGKHKRNTGRVSWRKMPYNLHMSVQRETVPRETILDHQQTERKMTAHAFDLSEAYNRLAQLFWRMGRHEDAVEYKRRSRTFSMRAGTHSEKDIELESRLHRK